MQVTCVFTKIIRSEKSKLKFKNICVFKILSSHILILPQFYRAMKDCVLFQTNQERDRVTTFQRMTNSQATIEWKNRKIENSSRIFRLLAQWLHECVDEYKNGWMDKRIILVLLKRSESTVHMSIQSINIHVSIMWLLLHMLQSVLHSAARLVCKCRKYDRMTSLLRGLLHWLAVQ